MSCFFLFLDRLVQQHKCLLFQPHLDAVCFLFLCWVFFVFFVSVSTTPSDSPLTMSKHLLSCLLFVSRHAEPCQPFTDTHCLFTFISLKQENPSVFISFCAIYLPRFLLFSFCPLNIKHSKQDRVSVTAYVKQEKLYQ